MTETPTCEICKKPIQGMYIHHVRLNVDICGTCPLDNVKGEDVSNHTVDVRRAGGAPMNDDLTYRLLRLGFPALVVLATIWWWLP
jgi:hypothetical protein